ncbi:putative ribonuclease H-like domain-containing protein [Tanacetum coccineum]
MVKPVWNNAQRVNHQNFAKKTHPCAKKNLVPRAVLMKSGLVSVNTARQVNATHSKTTVNAARPMSYLSKTTHSTVKRPIHKNTAFKNNDYSRFTWVFFLATKDETSGILKSFITGIENLVDHKVKVIRCDNGTEFKNKEMNQFCEKKDILRQFSVARTSQQNRVVERRNKTLIKAARTMLADSKLPTTFWAEAVNTACYVQNRVLVVKPHNKTPYELFHGTQSNGFAGTKASDNAGQARKETTLDQIMLDWKITSIFEDDDDGWVFEFAEADMNNLETNIQEETQNRLIAQGYQQGRREFDYDEVFALVARIEAIRLFLAYASFKDFVVYQMDVKSAFLYGNIEEEVYVCQPPGFEDPNFPDRIYKVEKALYGLHQDPTAWYETLSTYLLDNEFQRGKINKTLFIKRYKGDILLMSSMRELTFFLGLQVERKKDGIFISQDKYVGEILKKFGFTEVKTASTPMETQKPLLKDEDGEEVDVHMYRSMIGSLMYLTSSRPDIMFAVARNRQWLQIPQQKLNMWLLQVVMDK